MSTNESVERELDNAGIAKGAFGGAFAGMIGNVVTFFAAKAAGVAFVAQLQGPAAPVTELEVAQVAIASVVPALGATLLALALNRFTRRPAMIFTVIAAVFGLLSLGGPLNLGGASTGMKITLDVMHVISAAAITLGITRLGRRR